MNKDFNLSKKSYYSQTMLRKVYFEEDVKEFIQQLKKDMGRQQILQ